MTNTTTVGMGMYITDIYGYFLIYTLIESNKNIYLWYIHTNNKS